MIMSEGAAAHRVDRGMPRGIELVIGPDDRVGVVLGLGAIVVRSGRPESEGRGVADGGAVVGRRRIVLARRHRGRHEKEQQGCGFHGFVLMFALLRRSRQWPWALPNWPQQFRYNGGMWTTAVILAGIPMVS